MAWTMPAGTLKKSPFFESSSFNKSSHFPLSIKSSASFLSFVFRPYILESVIKGRGEIIIDDETYPIKKGDFFIITNYAKSYSFKGNLEIVESSSK